MKAVIIGAGVCGPVTAMALQRAGIDAVVYEAHGPATDVGSYLTGFAPSTRMMVCLRRASRPPGTSC